MPEESFLKKIYNLVIINTLEKVEDKFDIHGLVAGAIVGTFGFLICWIFSYIFGYYLPDSQIVVELGIFAYLSIVVHHYFEFRRELWKTLKRPVRKLENFILIMAVGVAMFAIYLMLLNSSIGVLRFYSGIADQGRLVVFLRTLPGLVVLALPLFTWHQLAKWTPIDDLVRKIMGASIGGKDASK